MSPNYVTYTILRGEYPEESQEKRSFAFAQDAKILYSGISPTRHCDERSEEAIHKSTFKCVQAGTSKRKGKVFSWIASLSLAMTPSVILRGVNPEESQEKRSFTFVQDDSKSHSEAECRRISCEKRSFGFHPQDDRVLKKKAAFTLAEVLITLGIIGIVAAMTLPTLLSNVQDKILESESKKAANIVANGYKLMMARDEIFNIKDMPMWQCQDLACISGFHREIFNISNDNQAVLENLKNVKYYNSKNQAVPFSWEREPVYAFITTDGFAYGVLPNRVAKDLHKYRFSGEGGQLFDVTDELEQLSECSIDNPEGCTTREECFSLPTGVGVCSQWKNNKCSIIYNCAV